MAYNVLWDNAHSETY